MMAPVKSTAVFLLLFPLWAHAAQVSFWTGRSEPLSTEEQAMLDKDEAKNLYWQVGTLLDHSGDWHWDDMPLRLPQAHQTVIPVVHLDIKVADPFQKTDDLLGKLKKVVANGSLALDYDCPIAKLTEYAAFLQKARELAPHLAVIAREGWTDAPGFDDLQQSVEQFLPRFYDDEATVVAGGKREPAALLYNEASEKKAFSAWGQQKTKWQAILPNFARLAVFNRSSVPYKVAHSWTWNEALLDPALLPVAPMKNGTLVMKAAHTMQVGSASMRGSETLVLAMMEPSQIQQAMDAASAAGAAGVVFQLPGESAETGWSLAQLGNLGNTETGFSVKVDDERLVLSNTSSADLPPRSETAEDRGYLLEISAPAKVYHTATEGDFYDVAGIEAADDSVARHRREQMLKGNLWHPIARDPSLAVDPSLARRLQFSFAALRSGKSMATGVVRLVAGYDYSVLRYRVLPVQPQWKPLDAVVNLPQKSDQQSDDSE